MTPLAAWSTSIRRGAGSTSPAATPVSTSRRSCRRSTSPGRKASRQLGDPGGRASRLVDPYFQLRTLANGAAAVIAIEHDIHGPSANFVQGAVAGAHAIQAALDDLAEERVDVALVVGCDGLLSTSILQAYAAVNLLSPLVPPGAMRPFDAARAGLVPGIGAGALVLERGGPGRTRNAHRLGAIAAVGTAASSADAPATARDVSALQRAFAAVESHGVTRSGGLLVVAHGDATNEGDANELRALAQVLPGDSLVTAFKGATGFIGAAGLIVETALALHALANRTAPSIVGCDRLAAEASESGLDLVVGVARSLATNGGRAALTAWSWSGACAVVVVDGAGHE